MVLKWLGGVLVIGSCSFLGFYYSGQTRRRLSQMRAVRQILYMLKGEIGFAAAALPEAFGNIASRTEPPFDSFLRRVSRRMEDLETETMETIWRQETRRMEGNLSLKREERSQWESLGSRLGYLDREMQLKVIELFLMQWEEKIRCLEQEVPRSCRLYQYLGVLAGLLLTVTLV